MNKTTCDDCAVSFEYGIPYEVVLCPKHAAVDELREQRDKILACHEDDAGVCADCRGLTGGEQGSPGGSWTKYFEMRNEVERVTIENDELRDQVRVLRGTLAGLVKVNEEWNEAVIGVMEKLNGRPVEWYAEYLDASKGALFLTAPRTPLSP